jgi:hypothetical protein
VSTNTYNMKNNNNNIKFSEQLGKVTDVKKLLKQINNLKANVKKKIDPSITGNKTKKLSAAEKIMCEVMQGDVTEPNPVLHKLTGISFRTNSHKNNDKSTYFIGNVTAGLVEIKGAEPPPEPHFSGEENPPHPPPKRAKLLDKYETEETKALTNSELQRLVLLEQLTVIRLKKENLLNKKTTTYIVLRKGAIIF